MSLPRGAEKRVLVRDMFDRIAPRYDMMNRLMTGGLDQRWRRQALSVVGVGAGDRVLDLACGTGDLCDLAHQLGASVVGLDFAGVMLHFARQRGTRADLVRGDAASLPIADGSIDVVTCGFALRNFISLPDVFAELARVLAPGGRIALIEVDRPRSGWARAAHSLYFDRVVPFVGGILSDRDAYRYLPESTAYLPGHEELAEMLRKADFEQIERRSLLLGSAQILTARRAGDQSHRPGRRASESRSGKPANEE